MDKEAQEKMALILWFLDTSIVVEKPIQKHRDGAKEILKTLEGLGYRKIKDKPPLLSDEEIDRIFKGKAIFASSPEMEREAMASLVAHAQREADIKFYEGK